MRLQQSGSNIHHVGIAEIAFSDLPDDVLMAPNLGSCLGIAAYDPKGKRGGLVHCLLPLSKKQPEKAKTKPCMFVDTGFVTLLSELIARGSNKRDIRIVVVGGAQINDPNNVFEIGKKNFTVFRKVLWKNNLLISAEHVGDTVSRTISLHIETGEVFVKVRGELIKL